MSDTTKRYAGSCLSGAGFAIMHPPIAWQLRPDLWTTGEMCVQSGWNIKMPGTVRMLADLEGYGQVLVLARSIDNLAQRIEWIVGAKVKDVQPAPDAQPKAADHPWEEHARKVAAEKLAKLKKLAAQEPPTHDCHLRKEILRARKELQTMSTSK